MRTTLLFTIGGIVMVATSCMPAQNTTPLPENTAPAVQKNENASSAVVPLPTREDIIRTFFNLINEEKLVDAVNMMDATENTKQAWAVNFNTLRAISVKSIDPVYKEEWTNTREVYKVTLDVSVKPVENAYGWENGINTRWIALQKSNDQWVIHELANNP